MAWECRKGRGRYYTRSRRVNGRVVREYLGIGELARAASQADFARREEMKQRMAAWRTRQDSFKRLDAQLSSFWEASQTLVYLALHAAGYHLHKRGEWRR